MKTGLALRITTTLIIAAVFLAIPANCGFAEQAANKDVIANQVTEKLDIIKPVPFTVVHLTDIFWAPRIEINRSITIPFTFKQCEQTGRVGNFERAAKALRGEKLDDDGIRGFSFDDTDIYKVLEGASFGLAVKPDPNMDKYLDGLIAKIAAAQEPDGYLYTARTINPQHPHNWAGSERWVKEPDMSHELYNAGHLFEAAVAHYQATGKKTLLNIATKEADLLCRTFGPDKRTEWPGHQVVEMALCKLYRVTGEKKYLDLAKFYLDTRGPDARRGPYAQAHKKVVEQDEAVGHAVRATYMYSGMADVAALTGDTSYITAIDKIWENVVGKKMYITGGIGASSGNEGFTGNYRLPNNSYCETCAAIGNAYWNHRLFFLHGDAKYIDVLELCLYNAIIDGVSLDGTKFFYPNPLTSDGQHERAGWFACACCPGNIARFMASVPGYLYAVKGEAIYVNLFAGGTADIKLNNNAVKITQQTKYPWDGNIKMTIEPQIAAKFTINVRIPGWAQDKPVPSDLYSYLDKSDQKPTLSLNGQSVEVKPENGYVRLDRQWKAGDTIELILPMPIRRVIANDKVKADAGRVAIQRGPIVFCAEWLDNNGGTHNLILPDGSKLSGEYKADMLGGGEVLTAKGFAVKQAEENKPIVKQEQTITFIPYYAWANRGKGQMDVWVTREKNLSN
jgi:DUF1680 family protein